MRERRQGLMEGKHPDRRFGQKRTSDLRCRRKPRRGGRRLQHRRTLRAGSADGAHGLVENTDLNVDRLDDKVVANGRVGIGRQAADDGLGDSAAFELGTKVWLVVTSKSLH
jgi:hypothetical protein